MVYSFPPSVPPLDRFCMCICGIHAYTYVCVSMYIYLKMLEKLITTLGARVIEIYVLYNLDTII